MNGFIILDKPRGISSAKAVATVKRLLPKKTKIGHTGTLDPHVEGVLPLAIGKATKAVAFMTEEKKSYRATVQLGIKTDTADRWGELLDRQAVPKLTKADILTVLASFVGQSQQVPPMFSALKKDGVRLYQLARQGKTVAREARPMTIYSIDLLTNTAQSFSFDVTCSRGSYIRTLCEDIAAAFGTVGTMSALKRLASGPFTLTDSVALTELTSTSLRQHLLPTDYYFQTLPTITVDYRHAHHLLNGVKVNLLRFGGDGTKQGQRYAVYYRQIFIGIAQLVDQTIMMKKVFCDKSAITGE